MVEICHKQQLSDGDATEYIQTSWNGSKHPDSKNSAFFGQIKQ